MIFQSMPIRQTLLATLIACQCGVSAWGQAQNPFAPLSSAVPGKTPTSAPSPSATEMQLPPNAEQKSIRVDTPQAEQPATISLPAAVAPSATSLRANAPTGINQPTASLRFDNADIYDVIQVVLGEILKVDYVVEPGVQGKVTLRSTSAVQTADLFGVLETALAQVGVALVKSGSGYKVMRDSQAAREPLPEKGGGESSPVMRVIPLRFVQAAQVSATLKPFASAGGAIVPDPTGKYLLVFDRQAVVERLVNLAETLDNEFLRDVHVRLLRPQHGDPTEISKELEALVKTSGLFNLPNTDTAKAFFLPVPRLGALMVASGSPVMLQVVEKWFAMLDAVPGKDADAMVHVYPVANGNALHLTDILQQVVNGQGGGGGSSPGSQRASGAGGGSTAASPVPSAGGASAATNQTASFGLAAAGSGGGGVISRGSVPGGAASQPTSSGFAGPVSIIADEITNTIIVKASSADFARIQNVLKKIDTQPRQVLIQVTVAEVTLNDTLQYGVEWWLKSNATSGGKAWTARAGLEGLIKAPTSPGVVSGVGTGFNYALFNSSSQIIGLLNLLGNDTKVNLLSAPHVLTTDGKVARVEIGNDEPVVTQTVQTPSTNLGNLTTSNSVQYRPTGIILEVRPSISANGMVTMSVAQEVSNRAGSVSVGGSEYPNFSKRRVSTEVAVQDGKTILIAGLIEDKGDNASVGIPTLKDVPLFGALFGTSKTVKNKTELLITITPHIVTSSQDADRIKADFMNSVNELGTLLQSRSTPRL